MSAPGVGVKANNRKNKPPEPVEVAAASPVAPVAERNEASDIQELNAEEVARLAYSYWESRAGQGGSAEEDWLRAEQELRTRK